jgi:hypothetical protein
MSREGFHTLIDSQAETYLKRGEERIRQALDSQTLDAHGAALYAAALDLFAARRLYDALYVRPLPGLSAEQVSRYHKASDVAEEKCVRASAALVNGLQNRAGEKLEEHQEWVRQARASGGESAADDVVFELIEIRYYYPRYFESVLKEQEKDSTEPNR